MAIPVATAQDLISINDLISRLPANQKAAIGRARAAYNAAQADQATSYATDADYWFFVFSMANASYLAQYP